LLLKVIYLNISRETSNLRMGLIMLIKLPCDNDVGCRKTAEKHLSCFLICKFSPTSLHFCVFEHSTLFFLVGLIHIIVLISGSRSWSWGLGRAPKVRDESRRRRRQEEGWSVGRRTRGVSPSPQGEGSNFFIF